MDHQAAAVALLLDAPYQQSLARDSPGDEAEALGLACDLSVAGAAAAPPIRPRASSGLLLGVYHRVHFALFISQKGGQMSTASLPSPEQPTTTHGIPGRTKTLRLGTFADGQRAVPVRVTYSPEVGSFGHVERK